MGLHNRIYSELARHNVVNLSYVDNEGIVQSCALWYAADDSLTLYFLSSLSTRHGDSFSPNHSVAFTVNKDDQSWNEIKGLQARGVVNLVPNEEQDHAWGCYISKYPIVTDQFDELEEALKKTKMWKLTPKWIRLIDNSIGFGHKEELEFD